MRELQGGFIELSILKGPRKKRRLQRIPFLNHVFSKAVFLVVLFFLICGIITRYTHLGECASDSLKGFKYALFLKTSSFKRGDTVLILNHAVKYKGDIAFVKHISGMSGDILYRDKEGLCVVSVAQKDKLLELTPASSQTGASQPLEAKSPEAKSLGIKCLETKPLPLLDHTQEGLPLTPLAIEVIPEGYVFVTGDHPRSFDSRYEEFGLVAQDKLWGKALVTW